MGQAERIISEIGTSGASSAARSRSPVDYEDFFEKGDIALHLVDPNGIILHANRAELNLLGYAA